MYVIWTLLVVAATLQNGFSLIGEETDLNSLSTYEAIDDDGSDLWAADGDVLQVKIQELCKDNENVVFIEEEDLTIDCRALNSDKAETADRIVKREVDDEGSGDGDDVIQEAETGKPDVPEVASKVPEVVPETTEAAPVTPTNQEVEEIKAPAEVPVIDQDTTTEASVTTASAQTPPINQEGGNDETTREVTVTTSAPTTEGSKIADEESEDGADSTTLIPTVEQETQDVKENESSDPETSDKDGFSPKQSVEIHEKGLLNPRTNEEMKEQPSIDDDSVKLDGSTQDTKKAGSSKDTTILVVLFVAVLVVGALAFGYNFLKKRKQRAADLERVERSPIKRSLQNLTAKLEGEAEKKPLMDGAKEVEMVEMKKATLEEETSPESVVVK